MICKNCKNDNGTDAYRCVKCNYGLARRPEPEKSEKPRFLGDDGLETRDNQLARTFQCTNCRSHGGRVKRIATTGAGFSRLLDLQLNELIIVSCTFCGVVQIYDPEIVDKVSTGWPIIDLLTDLG